MRFKIIISITFIILLFCVAYSAAEDILPQARGSWVIRPIKIPEPEKEDPLTAAERQRILPEMQGDVDTGSTVAGGERSKEKKALPGSPSTQTDTGGYYREIKEIRFKTTARDEETILFMLKGSHTPDTFTLEGDRPRVVCDFPDTRLHSSIGMQIKTNGKIIRLIRVGHFQDPEPGLRVVLDLVPDKARDYEIQPVFFDDLNIYAIIVR